MTIEKSSTPTPRRLALSLAAVVLTLATLTAVPGTAAETGSSQPPVRLELAVAGLETIPVSTRSTGSLEPWRKVSPGTKILGRVDKVAVTEGDRVERGALLARLESRDLEAAVAQAEAAIRMAEANLENARAQRDRMASLHARGSVTDKNLEDATAGFRVAEAGLDQARANLAAAKVMLSYAEIKSPFAGWVVAKHVEAGDMANPGMALFTLEDLSKVKVNVQVPEADVVAMKVGDAATIEVLGRELQAEISSIVPAGDPASRTFSVRLVVDNPDGDLKSGMFARASFASGERRALRLPETALVTRGQLDGVFVAGDDGTVRLRWLKLGRREGGRVEVLSGLEEGERYAVAPPPGLTDGVPYEAR